jgi:DNA polymerase
LADERTRYLEIQRELGGDEVILSKPLGMAEGGKDGKTEGRKDARSEGEAREGLHSAERPAVRADRGPATPPVNLPSFRPTDWRKGAPAIPTVPGLVVQAPQRGLMDPAPAWENLDEVARTIAGCRKCFLCEGRTHTVPGEGSSTAKLMFVGEGPGQTEDQTGRPFVGKAGELLTQIIEAIGLRREEVYIANAVKCRPPQNRKPLPDELAACWPYLERQIELIRPGVLVALGATAAEALLQARKSLAELRGRVHSYRGIPLVVTYHPAALLRNPNWKKPTWDDVRIARQLLDR